MPAEPTDPTDPEEPADEPDDTEAAEETVDSDIEVPEADAVEQARTVPTDEDEYR